MREKCVLTRIRKIRATADDGVYNLYRCSNCGDEFESNVKPRSCETCDAIVTKVEPLPELPADRPTDEAENPAPQDENRLIENEPSHGTVTPDGNQKGRDEGR
jgi:DNA-directed RNA polymerase subunit RPC12/RpoP